MVGGGHGAEDECQEHTTGFFVACGHAAIDLQPLKEIFDAMPRPVESLIIGFRTLCIFARGNARFTSATAQVVAVLAAVEAFVSGHHAVMQIGGEHGRRGKITDVPAGEDEFARQPQQRIANRVNFRVQPATGASHGLSGTVFGAVGVLMDLAVRAVFKNHFGIFSQQQLFVEPVEEPVQREPVEVLIDSTPVSEFIRQRAPCASIAQEIPQGVEVFIKRCCPSARRHNVVASGAPLLALIF